MLNKAFIIFILVISFAFAGNTRLDNTQYNVMIEEANSSIDQVIQDNKGVFDLQVIKDSFLLDFLNDLVAENLITEAESASLIISFNQYKISAEKDSASNTGAAFKIFFKDKLSEINNSPLPMLKENALCNRGTCGDGLTCMPDPNRVNASNSQCKDISVTCKKDSDCCSGACLSADGASEKVCQKAMTCFAPVNLGSSCKVNPNCREGKCSIYDANVLGINECKSSANACNTNSECCSGLCSGNICKDNFVCLACAGNGEKTNDKKPKCCEGYIKDDNGTCVGAVAPVIPPEIIDGTANENSISPLAKSNEKLNYSDAFKKAGITLGAKSNFDKCEFHFMNDYLANLSAKDGFQMELAMLGFDYVMSGAEGNNDYWKLDSNTESSINGRLRKIAQGHLKERGAHSDKFSKIDLKLTCICLDTKGNDKITDSQKEFFNSKCGDYKTSVKNTLSNDGVDESNNAASGIKAKKIMVYWLKEMQVMLQDLTVSNYHQFQNLADVREFVAGRTPGPGQFIDTSKNSKKSYVINTYTVKSYSFLIKLFAFVTFGLSGLLVLYATSGGGSGVSLAVSVLAYFVGVNPTITQEEELNAKKSALFGAWVVNTPFIRDEVTKTRKCGIKKCIDHTVYLDQPFNSICNAHVSSTACMNNFIVVYDDQGGLHYVLDPFVPNEFKLSEIVPETQPQYIKMMEASFLKGLDYVKSQHLKKSSALSLSQAGSFSPDFGGAFERNYLLKSNQIQKIKDNAKTFAIKYGYFDSSDLQNLNKFAEYVFVYHFVKPREAKLAGIDKIVSLGYVPTGLPIYLTYMAHDVAAKLGSGTGKAAMSNLKLLNQYTADLLSDLQIYRDSAGSSMTAEQLNNLNGEISDLKNSLNIYNMIQSGVISAIPKMNYSSASSKTASGNGSLSSSQSGFINAIQGLNNHRENQLKKLAVYNTNSSSVSADRLAANNNAISAYRNSLSSPLTASNSIGFSFNKSNGKLNEVEVKKGEKETNSTNHKSNDSSKNDHSAGIFGIGSINGNKSFTTLQSNSKNNESDSKILKEDPDAIHLEEAIKARDKANKQQFQSKEDEEQSIFKKLTNAYIRNYDKVLNKKKKEVEVIEN